MCEAQKIADLVEGHPASAVTQGVRWTRRRTLTWSVVGERDDVKGIEDAGCVLELIVDGVLAVPKGSRVAICTLHGSLSALGQPVLARCQTFLGPGPAGLWMISRVSGPRYR